MRRRPVWKSLLKPPGRLMARSLQYNKTRQFVWMASTRDGCTFPCWLLERNTLWALSPQSGRARTKANPRQRWP
eukprot:361957-Chlamydomonas_euryale.AAC.1